MISFYENEVRVFICYLLIVYVKQMDGTEKKKSYYQHVYIHVHLYTITSVEFSTVKMFSEEK